MQPWPEPHSMDFVHVCGPPEEDVLFGPQAKASAAMTRTRERRMIGRDYHEWCYTRAMPFIGDVEVKSRFALAPLAGVSDWPFRLLCREMGASLVCTEMVSSHGIVHGGDQTLTYLERPPDERPFQVQIFGQDTDVLAEAARVLVENYGPIDLIDLNFGCPVKKVCSTGAGAAYLKDPARLELAVKSVARAVNVPVTVKLRGGWDDSQKNVVDCARAAEQGGAAKIGMHPRTRAQMYNGRADWTLIARVKAAVRIPVWGSGDLFTAHDALRMLAATGADGARIARGACGHPWIFRELDALERGEPLPPPPSVAEWRAVVERHLDLAVQNHRGAYHLAGVAPAKHRPQRERRDPESSAVRELRKHLMWYTRHRRGGLAFRRIVDQLDCAHDVRDAFDRFFPLDGSVPDEARAEPEPAQSAIAEA